MLVDALRCRLADLDPAPTALVANLAYNIAVPLHHAHDRQGCPACGAGPSCCSASSPSGSSRRRAPRPTRPCRCWSSSRASSRRSARCRARSSAPQPRVDSAFVTFTRSRPLPGGHAAGARHARAHLVRAAPQAARELAGRRRRRRAREPLTRADVQAALAALGLPDTTRPEELAPPTFVALAGSSAGSRRRDGRRRRRGRWRRCARRRRPGRGRGAGQDQPRPAGRPACAPTAFTRSSRPCCRSRSPTW